LKLNIGAYLGRGESLGRGEDRVAALVVNTGASSTVSRTGTDVWWFGCV
jgi:hypothetical protein